MNTTKISVGVLAIQGDFAEHIHCLKKAVATVNENRKGNKIDADIYEIRDLTKINDSLDGLIIPGGESTVMNRHLKTLGFIEKLKSWIRRKNKFTWGTCAGLILLSNRVVDDETTVGGLDISCSRNSYGRQADSFETTLSLHDNELKELASNDLYPGVFIRAPQIVSVDEDGVTVLSRLPEGHQLGDRSNAVAVRQENVMACSFHPELTSNLAWHIYFINQVFFYKDNN